LRTRRGTYFPFFFFQLEIQRISVLACMSNWR
jgi:hypothetical protein